MSSISCGTCCPGGEIQIIQNTDMSFQVWLTTSPSGLPLDLTPYLVASGGDIRANFIDSTGTEFHKTLSASGGLTVVSTPGGVIQIGLTAANTASLPTNIQSFEVEFIENVGLMNQTISVTQFLNSLKVSPRVSA